MSIQRRSGPRWFLVLAACLLCVPTTQAGEIWRAIFDTDTDAVVQFMPYPPAGPNDIVGSPLDGELPLNLWHLNVYVAGANYYWKAGRPLVAPGTYQDTTSSHSGLYRFRWTHLDAGGGTISVGFVSTEELYPLRDAMVVTMRTDTNTVTGQLQVRLWADAADIGGTGRMKTDFGYADLGPDPLSRQYCLAVGYDANTRVQRVGLFDADGVEIHGGSQIVPPTVCARFDYLGWESGTLPYGGEANVLAQAWRLDELAYFDDAQSAFAGLANAACCLPDGSCQGLLEADCAALGGQSMWSGSTCATVNCTGACCLPDSTCDAAATPVSCSAAGGSWMGFGADCGASNCSYGACCFADQTCANRTEAGCVGSLGTWVGPGTDCSQVSCPPAPTGACCRSEGSCDLQTDESCRTAGGEWLGAGTACDVGVCLGACCLPDASCVETVADNCASLCERWRGAGSTCAESLCPTPMGACCLSDGCRETSENDCRFLDGAWQGEGSTCSSATCSGHPGWWATFVNGMDEVAQFRSLPPSGPAILGTPSAGALPVTIPMLGHRQVGNLYPKAGRQLRAQRWYRDFRDTSTSHSALCRFRWTALYDGDQGSTPSGYSAWSYFGFITSLLDWPQQGDLGVLMENYKNGTTGSYWLGLYANAAAYGTDGTAKTTGPQWVNLGPSPFAQDFQFVISYNATTKTQTVGLYDANGSLIRSVSQNLSGVSPQFDYLGWQSYSLEAGGDQNIVAQSWLVKELAYFDTANGALEAMQSTDTGACCSADGTCQDGLRQLECGELGGIWQNAGSSCATARCAGACCLPNGLCADGHTADTCAGTGGQWKGGQTDCTVVACPLPPCQNPAADVDGDGDVDLRDFAAFQLCYTDTDDPAGLHDPVQCHCFDQDSDSDVDLADFLFWEACLSGDGTPADPACDDAPPRLKIVSTVVDFGDVAWSGYFSGGGPTAQTELRTLFQQVAAAGITRLYWWATTIGEYHYLSQAGPMYNNDGRGAWSQWLVSTIHDYDVLTTARQYATQYNLELYAWGAVIEDFYYGLHHAPDSPKAELYGEYPLANPLILAKPWLTRRHRTDPDAYLHAFCYAYPEVRRNKLIELDEMIAYGLDGIAYQTRTHTVLSNPDAYGFNDPIVKEYQCRHGVDIRSQPFDKGQWLDVRGDFFTEFLWKARQRSRPHGMSLLCQVEVPRDMTVGAGVRTPIPSENVGDFKWDWQTWLDLGIVDGVILQALGGGSDWNGHGWPQLVARIKSEFPNAYVAVQYEFDNSDTLQEFETILTDALSDPNVDEVVLYETLHLFDYLPGMLGVVRDVIDQVNQGR